MITYNAMVQDDEDIHGSCLESFTTRDAAEHYARCYNRLAQGSYLSKTLTCLVVESSDDTVSMSDLDRTNGDDLRMVFYNIHVHNGNDIAVSQSYVILSLQEVLVHFQQKPGHWMNGLNVRALMSPGSVFSMTSDRSKSFVRASTSDVALQDAQYYPEMVTSLN